MSKVFDDIKQGLEQALLTKKASGSSRNMRGTRWLDARHAEKRRSRMNIPASRS